MLENTSLLGISMEPRKNRRLLVAATYTVLMLVLLAIVLVPWGRGQYVQPLMNLVFLIPLGLTFHFFGSIVKQTVFPDRPVGALTILGLARKRREAGEPDERDLLVRNAAYFTAYRILAVYSLLVSLMLFPAFDSGSKPVLFLLVLPLLVFAPTLPQAVILWTEPDVLEESNDLKQALRG